MPCKLGVKDGLQTDREPDGRLAHVMPLPLIGCIGGKKSNTNTSWIQMSVMCVTLWGCYSPCWCPVLSLYSWPWNSCV